MAQIKNIQAEENFAVIRGYKNSMKITAKNGKVIDAAAHLIDDLESIGVLDDCLGNLLATLTAAGCVITIIASERVEEVM